MCFARNPLGEIHSSPAEVKTMLPIKKILAPTDFSAASMTAVETACELARHFGAELELLYVVPPIPTLPADMNYTFDVPNYTESLQQAAEEKLAEVVAGRVSSGIPARRSIAFGDPAAEIVRKAAQDRVDWIVISTHGLTGWRHLVFGSVAEKVVRTAACPVLTVRAPGGE